MEEGLERRAWSLARKRRSWQMLLPHIGDLPLRHVALQEVDQSRARRAASSTVDALHAVDRGRCGRGCRLFQASMRVQHGVALVHREHRAFDADRQLRVGDDDGDLDDAVALGAQAGHLEVDPDQVGVVRGEVRSSGHRRDRKRARRRTPTLSAMNPPSSDAASSPPRWSPRPGCQALARDAARCATSRAHRDAVPAPFATPSTLAAHQQGRRLHARHASAFGQWQMAFGAVAAARLDAARRPRPRSTTTLLDAVRPRLGGTPTAGAARRRVLRDRAACSTCRFDSLTPPSASRPRFGFNRMTWQLWIADARQGRAARRRHRRADRRRWCCGSWARQARSGGSGPGSPGSASTLIAAGAGADLDRAALQQVRAAGRRVAEARVQALMARCGFARQGPVRDGRQPPLGARQRLLHRLRRGQARRLLRHAARQLAPGEVEAVLAHELGHFKLGHIVTAGSLRDAVRRACRLFAAFGWLAGQSWFYTGLGVRPGAGRRRTTRSRCCSCWSSCRCSARSSRRCSPACRAATSSRPTPGRRAMPTAGRSPAALLKLHEDNASTLTPDPVYAPLLLLASAGRRTAGGTLPESACHDQLPRTEMQPARRRDERRRGPSPPCTRPAAGTPPTGAIEKTFAFKGWLETVAFVDALAWVCHVEDHHPDLRCLLRPLHHSLPRPTRPAASRVNDFICAAKADALVAFVG